MAAFLSICMASMRWTIDQNTPDSFQNIAQSIYGGVLLGVGVGFVITDGVVLYRRRVGVQNWVEEPPLGHRIQFYCNCGASSGSFGCLLGEDGGEDGETMS